MWQRFTEAARRVIYYAQAEAMRLNVQFVNSEHILFGIISEEENTSAIAVLSSLGLSMSQISAEFKLQVNEGKVIDHDKIKLSPDGKRVIEMAYKEALELKHDYISTAHLLLGLIREMTAKGGKILQSLGMDPQSTREAYIQLIKETGDPENNISYFGENTLKWQRFTQAARRVVYYAQVETSWSNVQFFNSEHLLFGIVRLGDDSSAIAVLSALGIRLSRISLKLELPDIEDKAIPSENMVLGSEAMRVIDMTRKEAVELKNDYISTAHLLLGLIREIDGLGGKILRGLGVELESARAAYLQLIKETGDREIAETFKPSHGKIISSLHELWMRWRRRISNA
jgi:ATP-dependent Clp protease ATP-binding subunit ClpA